MPSKMLAEAWVMIELQRFQRSTTHGLGATP